ncbi:MAG: response regulator [Treponema sp.]|jgi:CheY-like chemotaxis protein/nucleotide-binding universal stress UspA family protein|nr:response regulator [Treponema sp.]
MIEKKRLLSILNLKLAGKIEKMDDEQMGQYEQLLIAFIENFPGDETKIKAALEARDYDSLAAGLTAICETLEKIYATELAAECRKFLRVYFPHEFEKNEAYVTEFLKAVATLSIDIQMAKYLETDRSAEKKDSADDDSAAKKALSEKIILAVDDIPISLTMLKKALQDEPYKLICVNAADDALRYLKHHQPDLFILDIEMPKMNGYELAEKIRENGQTAPIIFLTGNATKRNVMRAIEAGGCDFVVKPIDKKYIVYKINKYL